MFPEFAPPIVGVQTESPGFAAEDVEALVTGPLEQALAGTPEVSKGRSESTPGLSTVIPLCNETAAGPGHVEERLDPMSRRTGD